MPVGTSVFLSYRPNACLKRRADGRTDCQTSRPTDRKTAYRVMNTNSKRLSYIYIRRVSGLSVCDGRGEAVFSEEADVTEDPRPISSPLFLIFFAHWLRQEAGPSFTLPDLSSATSVLKQPPTAAFWNLAIIFDARWHHQQNSRKVLTVRSWARGILHPIPSLLSVIFVIHSGLWPSTSVSNVTSPTWIEWIYRVSRIIDVTTTSGDDTWECCDRFLRYIHWRG